MTCSVTAAETHTHTHKVNHNN